MGRRSIAWRWACGALAAYVFLAVLPTLEQGLHTRPGDGAVDWLGARAWLAHVNVYSPEGLKMYGLSPYGFAHPPTAPFWLLPYAKWDVDQLGTMMGWTTVFLLVFHAVITVRELALPGGVALSALGVALVMHTSWFANDLAMAQVSEPIAFLYLLAWISLRRGNDMAAGIAVGLACTFKPFAGVLWLFLLALRRWRAAIVAVVAWLGVAAMMTSRFGLAAWLQWNAFNKATAVVWLGHLRNATLPGLVLRAFFPICRSGTHAPTLAATLVAATGGIAILALCLVRTIRARSLEQHDLLFAAWSAASVFVNPVAWEHYAFVLLLPIALLAAAGLRPDRARSARAVAMAAAMASSLLLSIDMHEKGAALRTWASGGMAHLRLHWLEAANWLPWALVLFAALYVVWRDEITGRAATQAPPPCSAAG